jgi:hypothetical protein
MTDQPGTARQPCNRYADRVTFEKLFHTDPFASAQVASGTARPRGVRRSPSPSGATGWSAEN